MGSSWHLRVAVIKIQLALKLFPFFNDFKGVVVSGIEKTVKPDSKIYQILLDRYDLISKQSLFIDDKLENVLAAQKLGIYGLHYTADIELANALNEFSIQF